MTAAKADRPCWLLLDGRAKMGPEGVDRATVMDTADTEAQARRRGKHDWRGYDAIWQDPSGQLRWDIPPCKAQP